MLKDKVAVVTGAGSGMGEAVAVELARQGASVVLAGRTLEKLERVAAKITALGGQALCVPTDVREPKQLRTLMATIEECYGRLDLAFNNAGGHGDLLPLHEISDEECRQVMDLNFSAVLYGMKYQIELMLKSGGGAIVNNASAFGLKGVAGLSPYVASKFAVVGLTRSAALDVAGKNIRINAICPGATETPNYMRVTDGDLHAFDSMIPMGRIGQPQEVAQGVIWLLSEQSSYVTGSTLSVDGGMAAG